MLWCRSFVIFEDIGFTFDPADCEIEGDVILGFGSRWRTRERGFEPRMLFIWKTWVKLGPALMVA